MRTPVKVRKKAKRADRLFGLWKALLFMPRLLKFYPTNRFVIWSLCLFNTISRPTEKQSFTRHENMFCFVFLFVFAALQDEPLSTSSGADWQMVLSNFIWMDSMNSLVIIQFRYMHDCWERRKKKSTSTDWQSRLDYFHFKNIAFNEDKRCQVFKKIKIEISRNIVPQKRPDLLRLVVSAETPTDRFHFMS